MPARLLDYDIDRHRADQVILYGWLSFLRFVSLFTLRYGFGESIIGRVYANFLTLDILDQKHSHDNGFSRRHTMRFVSRIHRITKYTAVRPVLFKAKFKLFDHGSLEHPTATKWRGIDRQGPMRLAFCTYLNFTDNDARASTKERYIVFIVVSFSPWYAISTLSQQYSSYLPRMSITQSPDPKDIPYITQARPEKPLSAVVPPWFK